MFGELLTLKCINKYVEIEGRVVGRMKTDPRGSILMSI
jgi:hypothetical protein